MAACKGIGSSLHQLEIGNEVNIGMFTSGLPITYNMDDYIADWNWKAHAVVDVVGKACPDRQLLKFMAPSFIMLSNNILDGLPVDIEKSFPPGWELEKLFDGGYDAKMVKEISAHKYYTYQRPSSFPSLYYSMY